MPIEYMVDANAILDVDIYNQTVAASQAERTPTACCYQNTDSDVSPYLDCRACNESDPIGRAAVCNAINNLQMYAGTGATYASVSTFSSALSTPTSPYFIQPPEKQITCEKATYVGCMTAPCVDSGNTVTLGEGGPTYDLHICTCPTYDGLYQVGTLTDASQCTLDDGAAQPRNIWSAAYAVLPT